MGIVKVWLNLQSNDDISETKRIDTQMFVFLDYHLDLKGFSSVETTEKLTDFYWVI